MSAVDPDNGLTLVFDGEASASQKKYKMLISGSTPAVGDRVAAVKHSGTYIVLGAIGTTGGGGSTPSADPRTVYAGPATGSTAAAAAFRQLTAGDLSVISANPHAVLAGPASGSAAGNAGFRQLTPADINGSLFDIVSPDLHESNPPSSGTHGNGVQFLDADGNVMGWVKPYLWSDGSQTLQLVASVDSDGSRANNIFSITKRKNGANEIYLSSPLPVSYGGTGMSQTEYYSSNIFTPTTGVTVNAQHAAIWGKVCMIELSVKLSADIADGATKYIGRLSSRFYPRLDANVDFDKSARGYIAWSVSSTSAGNITIYGPYTASSTGAILKSVFVLP